MNLADAKEQAEAALRPIADRVAAGEDLSTEVLNEIENQVNNLLYLWHLKNYHVHDGRGRLVKGIKLCYDLFNGSLQTRFRY